VKFRLLFVPALLGFFAGGHEAVGQPPTTRVAAVSELPVKFTGGFDYLKAVGRSADEPAPVPEPVADPLPPKGKGLMVPTDLRARTLKSWSRNGLKLSALMDVALPAAFDAREKGWVPPVKDQGSCGSCWDFAGTGVVESAFWRAGQKLNLSEQYTLDCGNNGGCNGDWPETVLEWAKKTGLPTTELYGPYQGREGRCKSIDTARLMKIADFGYVGATDDVPSVDLIKGALYAHGPLAVAVAADNAFSNYSGGIFQGSGSRGINHAVILVGWKDDPTARTGGYWIMRNSWSERWGEQGYMRIAYGANRIGFGAMWCDVTAPTPDPTPPVPPGPTPPVPPGPNPPAPGSGFTGTVTTTYVNGVVVNISTGSSSVEKQFADLGLDAAVVLVDVKQLAEHIKAKADFATLTADFNKLVTNIQKMLDKSKAEAPPCCGRSSADVHLAPVRRVDADLYAVLAC